MYDTLNLVLKLTQENNKGLYHYYDLHRETLKRLDKSVHFM